MVEYAYTTVPGKIKQILEKIRHAGIPSKMNRDWMKSVRFTSSNDFSLISVSKFINFVDASGTPTQHWQQYRGNNHKTVLAEAIKTGYSDLFSLYHDAHARPQADIEHVFRTRSSAGGQAISKTYATFKALVDEADFPMSVPNSVATPHVPVSPPTPEFSSGSQLNGSTNHSSPSIHIDIQIHISPESSTQQIDQIFESMAKHLYGESRNR